uniref:Uncharacterized protein n=1 Tax=Mycena chlorophos TaxID=658473 RepID=A0ABQ0LJG7_MYCCL|nr:predicted protein [Mycena chlorophos]
MHNQFDTGGGNKRARIPATAPRCAWAQPQVEHGSDRTDATIVHRIQHVSLEYLPASSAPPQPFLQVLSSPPCRSDFVLSLSDGMILFLLTPPPPSARAPTMAFAVNSVLAPSPQQPWLGPTKAEHIFDSSSKFCDPIQALPCLAGAFKS